MDPVLQIDRHIPEWFLVLHFAAKNNETAHRCEALTNKELGIPRTLTALRKKKL